MIPDLKLTLTGAPLADIGLDGLMVRYVDGSEGPLLGLLLYNGETTQEALDRFCREAKATVYVPNGRD